MEKKRCMHLNRTYIVISKQIFEKIFKELAEVILKGVIEAVFRRININTKIYKGITKLSKKFSKAQ